MGKHFGQKIHLIAIPINVYIIMPLQSNAISTFKGIKTNTDAKYWASSVVFHFLSFQFLNYAILGE